MASLLIGTNATRVTIPGVFEGVPVYQDTVHISKLFIKKKLPVLLSELRRQKVLQQNININEYEVYMNFILLLSRLSIS